MASTLKGLRIGEVSLVDAPANQGALHVLFKRKDSPMATAKKTETALDRLLSKLGLNKRAEPGNIETYADAASGEVDVATAALKSSIDSIIADTAITDKAPAIAKSMAEFRAHLGEAMPEVIEKAMRDVAALSITKDSTDMTPEETIAALTKQLADAQADLDKAKKPLPKKGEPGYVDPADADADDTKKRDLAIAKAVSDGIDAATVELRKRVAVFEAKDELAVMTKRATDAGIPAANAELILKASKGDPESFDKMLDLFKAQAAQLKSSVIFKEFGGSSGTGADGSALAEIEGHAATLIKADPTMSLIAAKVAVRKSQPALAQRERDEERARVHAVS